MSSDKPGKEEMLGIMWRLAAVGTDVETSILLYSAQIWWSLGVYNIRILTVRGWRVASWLGLFLSRCLSVEDHLTLYYFSDL